jgi:DNA-binding NarL/FixJ family response regulator
VLCVDDHPMVFEGLEAEFQIRGDVEIVGRLKTAARLVDEVRRLRPCVVVLDIEMPGPDAFEAADRLRRAHPQVRVLVLTAYIRGVYLSAALAAGAGAYYCKADNPTDIANGIRSLARRPPEAFLLGPQVALDYLMAPTSGTAHEGAGTGGGDGVAPRPWEHPQASPVDSLSSREVQVLRLVGQGFSRTQIAAQLCRSVRTVDGHEGRMLRKLGIKSRVGLMHFAIREGLADV